MSEVAVDAVLRQAADFTRRIAETYEQDIAAGEVGINGSAVASEDPIVATREPTALMYGRVQSGKTAAMKSPRQPRTSKAAPKNNAARRYPNE